MSQAPNPWPGQPMPQMPQPAPVQPPAYPSQPAAFPGQPAQFPGQPAQFPGQQPAFTGQPGMPGQPGYGYPGQMVAKPAAPAIDLSKVSLFHWLVLGGGFLAFIMSFLPFYSYKVSVLGINESGSLTAWHGFFGWFGALLLLGAAALVALNIFMGLKNPILPLVTLLAAGVGLLCVVLAIIVYAARAKSQLGGLGNLGDLGDLSGSVKFGGGIGFWLCLICALTATAGALMLYLNDKKANQPAIAYHPGFAPQAPQAAGWQHQGMAQPGFPQAPAPAPQPGFPAPQMGFPPPAAPAQQNGFPPMPQPTAQPPSWTPQPPTA